MSHFRSATLTWDQTDLYSFTFSGQQSYRASYVGNPAVGTVFVVGTLNFGDGTSTTLYVRTLSLDTVNDIAVGELCDANGNPITHTYPSVVANYEAFFSSSARIATNDEFNQTGYRSEVIVNAGVLNEAPVSSVPAVVQVADNGVFTYQLAAVDPDGDTLSFRIGDRSEFIGSGSGPVAPAGVTVSSTGLLTWDVRDSVASVTPGQQYTMTAMISDGLTATPIDFILQIVDTASNQAPTFTVVPGPQTLGVGQTVNLGVQASDPNGNLTTIQVLNPPAGMTTDYHADHSELHIDFTPTAPGDYVVTIQATDAGGLTAQTSITFSVPANAAPVVPDSPSVETDEQTAVVLIPAIAVADAELDALNAGDGDWGGTSFVITGVAPSADDRFGLDDEGALFTLDGTDLKLGDDVFAVIDTSTTGTLDILFVAGSVPVTTALVNDVLRHITYTNISDSPPASVQLGYAMADGDGGNDSGFVTVNLSAINDGPLNDIGAAVVIDEDAVASPVPDMSIADSDSGGDDVTVTFEVGEGSLAIRTDVVGGIVAGDIVFQDADTITVRAAVAEINATLAEADGLTYSPGLNFNGEDTLTVTTRDDGNNGEDPGLSGDDTYEEDVDTRTITINAVDDPGTASDDALGTLENVVATGNLFDDNGNGVDIDVDGLNIVAVNSEAEQVGQPILLASGALLTVNEDGSYSYNPNGRYDALAAPGSGASNTSATDSFTYTLEGGETATVTVTITGVDSDDLLMGTASDDTMNGGDSADDMRGFGGKDGMRGGAGEDRLNGGYEDDLLVGNEGADILDGYMGDDKLYGGLDNDRLFGGAGDDVLVGQRGDDLLNGGGGKDRLYGGLGDDALLGRGDDDRLVGGAGKDLLDGDRGDDFLLGGADDDTVRGDSGRDVLKGNSGDDRLNGGWGADDLYGGIGRDALKGGGGADDFFFTTPLGADNVDSILDFGVGADTIQLSRQVFSNIALGTLASDSFHLGEAAGDADDRIVYDAISGNIFYDEDGSGDTAAVLFATVTPGTILNSSDFVVFGG